MSTFLQRVLDDVRGNFGEPAKLIRTLQSNKKFVRPSLPEPPRSVALSDVVKWDGWGHPGYSVFQGEKPGTLYGWGPASDRFESASVKVPALLSLGERREVLDWTCDIRDVHGLSSSKSDLTTFESLDDLAVTNSPEMLQDIGQKGLQDNLAHKEIRVLHSESTHDCFVSYSWDHRIFLINSGGSHHFAAARYIAQRIGEPVPIRSKLTIHSLNENAVRALHKEFEIVCLQDHAGIQMDFHECMSAFRARYFTKLLPRPHDDTVAVFLPRSEPRSMKVALALKAHGAMDLNAHLQQLCDMQKHEENRPGPDLIRQEQ